jgi:hypothetical protein
MSDRHTKRVAHNKIDLTGKRFGKLVVLEDTGIRKSRRPIWKCLCDCGETKNILGKYLLNGDTKSCSCGCLTSGRAHNRTGYKELSGCYWYIVIAQAKRRGIPVLITPEDAYNKFISQNRKCAFTDEILTFSNSLRDERKNQTASLDRIDSNKGYTLDNIQWVHKTINIMKNTLSVEEFVEWASKVHTPQ